MNIIFQQGIDARAERGVLRPLGRGLTSVEMSDLRGMFAAPFCSTGALGAVAHVGCF
jgi:hypothetical protein